MGMISPGLWLAVIAGVAPHVLSFVHDVPGAWVQSSQARHFQGYVGYSHFFTGEFINTTGPHKDSDFFYAALQNTF